MIDKVEAARRQLECAIRLRAREDDKLAVHTLVMAAYTILENLAKGSVLYEDGLKPHLTAIGKARFRGIAAFLKHADRDPTGILPAFDPAENDWRIGFCILLYRDLKGTLTPAMGAFHCWMLLRYPDQFALAEDSDFEFERSYRQAIGIQKEAGLEIVLLNGLLKAYDDGVIPATTGFLRRPPRGPLH